MMLRRHFRARIQAALAAGLLILLAAASSVPGLIDKAWADEALKVGKSVPQAFGFTPLNVGVEEGIFKKNGVDVEIVDFGGAPRLAQGLISNAVDMGLGSGPDMANEVKGAPIKAVGAAAGAPMELTITVGTKSNINTIGDLKGRGISVSQIGSLTGWLVSTLSAQQGWGRDGIKLVIMNPMSAVLSALVTNEVDGITVDLSTALKLQQQGHGKLLVKFGDYIKDFHLYVIFATDDLIAKRPQAIRDFLKGWYQTIAWMKANKTQAVAIAAKVQNVDPGIVAGTYDLMMPVFSSDGHFNPKALATLSRSFVELGLLDKEPDMKTLYTEAFLPK
ncbi:MAG TPA: ABC transporter substrate-binding protein [Stellaceae bacterium]|nr:ABC transporter substrate-binding protein [Stellaceae bacterium]